MARRSTPPPPRQYLEEVIAKLRQELYFARRSIIELAPDNTHAILFGYYDCKTREDVHKWVSGAVDKLIAIADAKPARQMGDYGAVGDRALCPLCRRGSDNPFGISGFAVPTGLERHLEGSYNARECDVMKAAKELALEHIKDDFRLGPVS